MRLDLKQVAIGTLLVAIAIVGPLVAYAGVTTIWPDSTQNVGINTDPPIKFLQGADYQQGFDLGYVSPSPFDGHNNNASFNVTLKGLSGGTVVIDNYANITKTAAVTSYRVQLTDDYAGDITPAPTCIKLRFWDPAGAAPPADCTVQAPACGEIDVLAEAVNYQATVCTLASVKVQVVLVYGTDSTAVTGGSFKIKPNSIIYA